MPTADRTSSVISLHAEAELAVAAASCVPATALQAGMRAPLFTLADMQGKAVALEGLLDAGPVVLNFFRGEWCSYGARSLADFSTVARELAALGVRAVSIGPHSAPAAKQLQPANRTAANAAVVELCDVDMHVARAYGLTFNLPVSLRPLYQQLGYQPPDEDDVADSWLVPVPAVYLLDREGIVVLASVELDYRKRFDAASLLSALKALSPMKRERHA